MSKGERRQITTGEPPVDDRPILDERTLPWSLDAERAVLGSILIHNDAYIQASGIVKAPDFFRVAHRKIYEAMERLLEVPKGGVDLVTLRGELTAKGQIDDVGGASYISALIDGVPRSTNVVHYATLVRDQSRLRAIIATANTMMTQAYDGAATVSEILHAADQALIALQHGRDTGVIPSLLGSGARVLERIEYNHAHRGELRGVDTGFRTLNEQTTGWLGGDLVILAARPSVGKSAFTLNTAVAAARAGKRVAVFSLEMKQRQIEGRILSALSGVPKTQIDQGFIADDQWGRLSHAMGEMDSLDIHIDDRYDLGVNELRASCRRLQAESGLDLVIVDYIQLMSEDQPGRRQATRSEAVGAISRRLKKLAGELNVCMMVLSQLSRAGDQRTDTRPKLSDLRECVAAGEDVYDTVTGQWKPIEQIAAGDTAMGLGLSEDWQRPVDATASTVRACWGTGRQNVVKIRTRTGVTLRVTENHPIRTWDGWTSAGACSVGTRIATVKAIPEPTVARWAWTLDHAKLLGYLIADGSYIKHRSVSYVKADPVCVSEVVRIGREVFGLDPTVQPSASGPSHEVDLTMRGGAGPFGNALINWLRQIEIHGQYGPDKHVPVALWSAPNVVVAAFLGCLWAGDGTVVKRQEGGYSLKYSTTSARLAVEVQRLLWRFRVTSSRDAGAMNTKSTTPVFTVSILDRDNILQFARCITLPGQKGGRLDVAAAALASRGDNGQMDRYPLVLLDDIRALKEQRGWSWARLGYRCQGKEIGRADLKGVAERLGSQRLEQIATANILWDAIVTIEPDGTADTYDFRCDPQAPSTLVNGVFSHNSGALEQDADLVCFLHRKNHRESGLTNFILEKQRDGPTGTINLMFDRDIQLFTDAGEEPAPTPADVQQEDQHRKVQAIIRHRARKHA